MTAPATDSQAPPPSGLSLSTVAEAAALLYTYQQATQSLRNGLSGFIRMLWQSLGSYRAPQIPGFLSSLTPVIAGAQQQMASLTAAHIAQQQSTLLGTPFQPAMIDPAKVSGAAVRNGTSPGEVYGRPFHLVWRQLADLPREPGSVDQAIQAGEDRAVQTGLTDLQLAKTHAAQQAMAKDPHIIGYRRALEGAYSCGLCIVASTQLYHKRDLMPIHPGCDCEVQPVYEGQDVAAALNEHLLGDVHAAIADRFGTSASDARALRGTNDGEGNPLQYKNLIITHGHGELGPVLGVRGADFTGPSDLNN